jgi:hypothetical protein
MHSLSLSLVQRYILKLGMVTIPTLGSQVQAYIPRYSGGRGKRVMVQSQPWRLYLKRNKNKMD